MNRSKSKRGSRIKVLQLVNAYGGGPGMVVYNLAKWLNRDLFDVTCCRLVTWGRSQEEAIHQSLLDLGVESVNLRIDERVLRGLFDIRTSILLRRLMQKRQVDIVHTHLIRADFFGRLAAWSLRVPAVISTVHNVERYHTSWRPVPRLARWFDRVSSSRVDRVVCVSEAVRQALLESERLEPSKTCTILNGVDIEHYHPDGAQRSRTREELGVDPSRPIVGTVGRFHPQKGLPYLVQAALGLVRKRPDVVFLMVGEGPMRAPMWREIEVLGLANNFVFAGPRLDIREMLGAMDLFVLPSLWEGLPLAVLEAMAMGLPCIVSSVGGNCEVVRNGQTGWIVPPRDPGIIERRLLELLESEDLRRRMGVAGRHEVERRFDARVTAKGYEKLYLDIMDRKA